MSESNNLKKIFDKLYEEKHKTEQKIKDLSKSKNLPVTNDEEGRTFKVKINVAEEENIKFYNTLDEIIGTVINLIN